MVADVCATLCLGVASARICFVTGTACAQICTMNDLLLDDADDLQINDGDFVIGDATLQHQRHIIIAQKGEYKEHPEIGVGIDNALLDENPKALLTQIRRNFEYDGMRVNTLQINTNGTITVDAPYT